MNPTTDRTNITDTGYSYGGKDYQYETRLDGNNQPYKVDVLAGSAPAYNTVPKASTTTVSNLNKQDQVMSMQNQLAQMQNRGMTSDGTTAKYADGTIAQDNYQDPVLPQGASPIYGTVNGQANRIVGYNNTDIKSGIQTPTYFDSNSSTPAQSPEEKQFNDILSSMKASTDAQTARTIASIQQKYDSLKAQQKQINEGQSKGVQNALLTGGVTGQGSSAQYAPISSEGIMSAQLSYGVQKLAELDAQEQDLINQAQAAGDSKNFQLMEKSLNLAEKKREEKAVEAKTLNDKLIEQQVKAREKMIQSTRDTALADLYSQGITDPQEMLKALNGNGGDFTLKEVTDGLKGLVPDGLDDLVKTLRNNGAPQSVIQKVLSSGNINEAYLNAGNYAAGGSGIIGEYNFYRAQEEAAGRTPVGFQEYQNIDANRKKSIAAAGVSSGNYSGTTKGGQYASDLDALIGNVKNTIPTKFGQATFDQSIGKARTDADKISTIATIALKNSPATVREDFINQSVGIKQLDKALALLNTGVNTGVMNATKQYTYNLAGKDFDPQLAQINQLIVSAIQPYRNSVTGAAWGNQEESEYNQLFGGTKYSPAELKQRLEGVKEIMKDKSITALQAQIDPLGTYGSPMNDTTLTTPQAIAQTEAQAKQTIDNKYATFPDEIKTAVKSLFNAGKTNAQVIEYLKLKGQLQP